MIQNYLRLLEDIFRSQDPEAQCCPLPVDLSYCLLWPWLQCAGYLLGQHCLRGLFSLLGCTFSADFLVNLLEHYFLDSLIPPATVAFLCLF